MCALNSLLPFGHWFMEWPTTAQPCLWIGAFVRDPWVTRTACDASWSLGDHGDLAKIGELTTHNNPSIWESSTNLCGIFLPHDFSGPPRPWDHFSPPYGVLDGGPFLTDPMTWSGGFHRGYSQVWMVYFMGNPWKSAKKNRWFGGIPIDGNAAYHHLRAWLIVVLRLFRRPRAHDQCAPFSFKAWLLSPE